MIGPASVTKITNLHPEILIQLLTSFIGSFFLDLLLHVSGIEHLLVQVKSQLVIEVITWVLVTSLSPLALFKLLPIEHKFLHVLLSGRNISEIIFVSVRNFNTSLRVIHLSLHELLTLEIAKVFVSECFRSHIW